MANFAIEREIELAQLRGRLQEIKDSIYTQRQPITDIQASVTGPGRGPDSMPKGGWKPFAVPGPWGGFDNATWFKLKVKLPKSFKGHRAVALVRPGDSVGSLASNQLSGVPDKPNNIWTDPLSSPGESLCYIDGKPFQGLDIFRDELYLTEKAKGGDTFELVLEAVPSVRYDKKHIFKYADIAVMHTDVWTFFWDCEVPLKVYETLDKNYAPAQRLFALIAESVRMVDLQHIGLPEYYKSIAKARKHLLAGLKDFEASYGMGRLVLTGHSHIDTAWLWPLRESRRKVGRTFANVLGLMDKYPEFHFSFSQPELYMYCKEHFPGLWKRLKKRVKEGRWEPCGAPWIEQDSNVPSGESIIRQFLYGNRFFREEFGMQSRTAWLPDAFGYPWSLPQILKGCQIDTFVTTKIDWSMFTGFPYSFFQWQGIDGTRIDSVMPPLNYNGNPVPADCIQQWQKFRQKDRIEELPYPFGWGDGGGGPTMEMIEHGKRMKNIVGVPKMEFGRTQDCLDRMKTQCDTTKLPVYNDELYLELHRACQTTQARTKRNNRKCEVLLHDTEQLSALALLAGGRYDQAALWENWRIVLTNQFHDILPGSSITEVYAVADQDYATVKQRVGALQELALKTLTTAIDTSGPGQPVVVFNTLSWMRIDLVQAKVKLPGGDFHVIDSKGNTVPAQAIGKDEILFLAEAVPPLGHAVYRVLPGAAAEASEWPLAATGKTLENDFIRVTLDDHGRFTSVFDKLDEREVLAPGQRGNVLQLFDDRPHAHDAWDIDHNFDEERQWEPGKPDSVKVIEKGPIRAVVRVIRKTEKSTFTQDITLYAHTARIDVSTHVDWWEKRTLLKVAFPVDVLAPRATYHIQFGAIQRATHANDPRDRARFEVTGHHWADLSESDYGVSLLNDCKYGYDVKENVLRLSLLRSSIAPDPKADEGQHDFTYALYPHAGDWRAGTLQEGYALNYPLKGVAAAAAKGKLPPVQSFADMDAENVVIESIKKHEDSGALIVRCFEACGQRGTASITFGNTPKSVAACDMMEERDVRLKAKGNTVELYFTPYEIKTLKVSF
ncbi:MAG: alpha-mannosidase [Candidatus Hydrogenedentes bacterium]|nr:alpha-mannosidase [Candidatus Hydrogenedentota bacterium]